MWLLSQPNIREMVLFFGFFVIPDNPVVYYGGQTEIVKDIGLICISNPDSLVVSAGVEIVSSDNYGAFIIFVSIYLNIDVSDIEIIDNDCPWSPGTVAVIRLPRG